MNADTRAIRVAAGWLESLPAGMEKAAALALNRALEQGRTAATRAITKRYTVKAKDVRPTFSFKRAKKSDLEAELISKGKPLPLRTFAHSPASDTVGKRRKPVRVTVAAGHTGKLAGAFVWNRHISQREGAQRLPIRKLYGPSVPSMLGNEDIVKEVSGLMDDVAARRIDHEIERLTGGNGK